ncbi:MAG: GIY-YIG nuclease family protein [Methylococcales bacterium]|nr:GIY-YIG nuclease family protein [Methylococcales bacterium]MDD5754302.1 GIY-YIG nuclease family protein [Methylococcales bacterium]
MPVYFIAEDENPNYDNLRVKIGKGADVEKRLKQLQTGSPYKLKVMGWVETNDDRLLEKSLHNKYSIFRTHGEWFNLGVCDVLKEIKSHTTSGYISVNSHAFEIISFDRRDGVPEYFGAWQWTDVESSEFCPSCGWGGGLDYNENYGGNRCLKCGAIEELLYENYHDEETD